MSNIAVLLPTYNRPKILAQTIEKLRKNLTYDGYIQYYIGNDGDTLDPIPDTVILDGPKKGLGANLNHLIKNAMSDGFELFLSLDDDHWLKHPLNLNGHAQKLLEDETVGWMRFMGVSYHKLKAEQEGIYWRVDWNSDGLYITSMRPHLKHVRFHQFFGYYKEGIKLGKTEESFCHQCKTKARKNDNAPQVLIPMDFPTETGWDHVGDSWQLKGF